MARIRGAKEHAARLRRLTSPEAANVLTQALFTVGQNVQTDAQISITTGAVSGNNHKPSAPGTPPNNDSGTLANNIETIIAGPLHVQVTSNAPHAAIQEFGGTINHPGGTAYFIGDDGLAVFVPDSSILSTYLPRTKPHTITLPERPYMRPAVAKNRKPGIELVRNAVNKLLKGRK
ncbi:HK97 gp10 family phage protein [Sphingomonas histidinilytica]|uniref:hypothetical protein n=1 Tax=Rhizorhabdus histidinilytica TaxID=439228 RepID=UPI001ADD4AA0|nr:hypothetical protein [Rhizorhabdus histidinilytica]MBO9380450.1 HK97 gp10 family phage protein [Rhizorhabdus histidinilytica]